LVQFWITKSLCGQFHWLAHHKTKGEKFKKLTEETLTPLGSQNKTHPRLFEKHEFQVFLFDSQSFNIRNPSTAEKPFSNSTLFPSWHLGDDIACHDNSAHTYNFEGSCFRNILPSSFQWWNIKQNKRFPDYSCKFWKNLIKVNSSEKERLVGKNASWWVRALCTKWKEKLIGEKSLRVYCFCQCALW